MVNDVFFSEHKSLIDTLLARPQSKVVVACNPEDEDQVYGFLVGEGTSIVHFAYVKYNFRKLGLLKLMLKVAGYDTQPRLYITHVPRDFHKYKSRMDVVFNPYLLFA